MCPGGLSIGLEVVNFRLFCVKCYVVYLIMHCVGVSSYHSVERFCNRLYNSYAVDEGMLHLIHNWL